MTKREAVRQTEQENRLLELGFTQDEANTLRRISMTLHRWFELECGDSNEYMSYSIERDETTAKPFMVYHPNSGKTWREPIADRETGARKRLLSIVNTRAARVGTCDVVTYVQTDPRGCALYVLRPGDVPEGKDVESYYNRGICVY